MAYYSIEKSNRMAQQPMWYGGDGIPDGVPQVNSTIKPIDRELATSEIEKGEQVFMPTGEIFTALGKRHSKGKNSGTPVDLPEGAFIFSDYKPLAIKQKDKKLFKLKEGGNVKNSTPAKILSKEVDIKHHNQMIAIQKSTEHDLISKKSSELMLGKNFKKLGQVAFLQEEKKGFPDGIPGFAEGTAPLNDEKTETMQQQYQQGGFMQLGGNIWSGDKYGSRRRGTPQSNATIYSQSDWDSLARQLGYNGSKGVKGFQQYLYDYNNGQFKGEIDSLHEQYKPGPNNGAIDGNLGYRWDSIFNKARKIANPTVEIARMDRPNLGTQPIIKPKFPNITGISSTSPVESTEEKEELATLPYEPNVGLSGLQKFSLANSAYNASNIRKGQSLRQQAAFTPLNLERMDVQPQINAINNQTQQAYKASQVMNPIIARGMNSNTYGRGLEATSNAISQNRRENSAISNRENEYNNQGINKTAAMNTGFNKLYHDETERGNENYSIEKNFTRNRLIDEYKGYRTANDSLELDLASQPTFGTIEVYQNPETGEISKKPVEGWVKRKQAAPLYDWNSKRNRVQYTGAGLNLDQLSGTTNGMSFQQLQQYADSMGLDARGKAYIFRDWAKQQSNPLQRK